MKYGQIKPITTVHPDIRLAPSYTRKAVMAGMRLLAPLYLRLGLRFSSVTSLHAERAAGAFESFFSGKNRLLIAFRHPYGDEPQLLSYYILCRVRKDAAEAGIRMTRDPHALFIHGYEVPRWGGAFLRWLLPRMGALPVHHAKTDAAGLNRIRKAISDGQYPVALSPEGQVSYSPRSIPRIEQGAARIALWCAEDLRKAGRPEKVLILPVCFRYIPVTRSGHSAEKLLNLVENAVGTLSDSAGPTTDSPRSAGSAAAGSSRRAGLPLPPMQARINAATRETIAAAERFYGETARTNVSLKDRLDRLIRTALQTGERILGIPSDETLHPIERVYRIRQAGWDRIFREEGKQVEEMTILERATADRLAGEAWYAMRHMEFVDFAWYFDPEPIPDDSPADIIAERIQNTYDLVSRLMGGAFSDRKQVRPTRAYICFGDPISVSDASGRHDNKHGKDKKGAALRLTEEIRRAFQEGDDELWELPREE